jgi:hypothetical protein
VSVGARAQRLSCAENFAQLSEFGAVLPQNRAARLVRQREREGRVLFALGFLDELAYA